MDTWFARGVRVERWDVRSLQAVPGAVAVEWAFGCLWDGRHWEFEGASVARCGAEGITYLREYRTPGDLYEWDGTWRE